jgi:hypothetical protein
METVESFGAHQLLELAGEGRGIVGRGRRSPLGSAVRHGRSQRGGPQDGDRVQGRVCWLVESLGR